MSLCWLNNILLIPYLSHLIRDYLPPQTLRLSEQLLMTADLPRTTLTLSAKAFSVSAPSVWNSCGAENAGVEKSAR